MAENKIGKSIVGKIVLNGTVTNTSPLSIGKGENEETDLAISRWHDEKPYIPASSLIGCLNHRFFDRCNHTGLDEQTVEAFWGSRETSKTTTYQSHFVIDDLLWMGGKNVTAIRDGVKINPKTGIAVDGGKYDYELVETGSKFGFRMEVSIREGMDVETVKKLVKFIDVSLRDDELFRVGGKTSTGFGKLSYSPANAYYFDFGKPKAQGELWFAYLENEAAFKGEAVKLSLDDIDVGTLLVTPYDFKIEARFALKNSLIIGATPTDDSQPDKVHLKSNGNNILSGKSIKGALRHRALKILSTLNEGETEKILQNIMGWADETPNHKTKPIKSKLQVEETVLAATNGTSATPLVQPMPQARIRIDRFTGGTMRGALFETEAIWRKEGEFTLTFTLNSLDNESRAAPGLLLHLLKDLWTEDLALGGEKNIGRGVLQGKGATIKFNGKAVILTEDGRVSGDGKTDLEDYHKAFLNALGV